jgi:antitoxin MazE
LKSRVQKWGNSLALRIPKSFAEEVRVKEGSEVEITLKDRTLVVVPAARPPTLKQLLARVTSKNLHRETDTGTPQGNEVW